MAMLGFALPLLLLLLGLPANVAAAAQAQAQAGFQSPFSLHPIIGNNMVLQRDRETKIWGNTLDLEDYILLMIDSTESYTGSPNHRGVWEISIPSRPASFDHSFFISNGKRTHNMTLNNIAFGDVYLCSGQSNMELAVWAADRGAQTIDEAEDYPNIRFYTVDAYHGIPHSAEEEFKIKNKDERVNDQSWHVASQRTVDGSGFEGEYPSFSYPSAACYHALTHISKLTGGSIALGAVISAGSGANIETYSSPEAILECSDPFNGADQHNPSAYWWGLLHPFLRIPFRSIIWYQGENNAEGGMECRFPAMIRDFRDKWNYNNMNFVFVQLAADDEDGLVPFLRDEQLAALTLPHTGTAISVDLGDRTSTIGHSRLKSEIGKRLALSVVRDVYSKEIVNSGPIVDFVDWKAYAPPQKRESGDEGQDHDPNTDFGSVEIKVHFKSSEQFGGNGAYLDAGKGLNLRSTAQCRKCCEGESPFFICPEVKSMERACINLKVINLDSENLVITLSSPKELNDEQILNLQQVGEFKYFGYLRFEYTDYPECVLVNDEELPGVPFQYARGSNIDNIHDHADRKREPILDAEDAPESFIQDSTILLRSQLRPHRS